ncbi:MAG: hypothetical protein ACRBBN_00430 [Methyloligellaceae bacterium]
MRRSRLKRNAPAANSVPQLVRYAPLRAYALRFTNTPYEKQITEGTTRSRLGATAPRRKRRTCRRHSRKPKPKELQALTGGDRLPVHSAAPSEA